jgi:uncharacterized DUF497 family protein
MRPTSPSTNIAKHGVSLARAGDLEILAFLEDGRNNYGETRYRAWGLIDGKAYCLAFTDRNGILRAISLRRARKKEIDRYVPPKTTDTENPEWTEADFAAARPSSELPPTSGGHFHAPGGHRRKHPPRCPSRSA